MAGTRVTPTGLRHIAFDAIVGWQYLTRTGKVARLTRIEADASGDNTLHFVYVDAQGQPIKTATERDGFSMTERTASRLMIPVGA
jgi:hypothetical protein